MTKDIENATGSTLALRTLRAEYGDGHRIESHDHAWGQLIYAASGAIQVATPARTWLIPPARAVWLPPSAFHSLRMKGRTRLRTIYVPPGPSAELPGSAVGLNVTSLLRELILTLTTYAYVAADHPLQSTLAAALLATVAAAEPLTLVLTRPRDRRALKVAAEIEADPARNVPLARLAEENGMALRTLQRLFLAETGLPLSEWRQAARLLTSTVRLLEGESVTIAALDAGYSSTSAFIHAFRLRFGETPGVFRASASAQRRGSTSLDAAPSPT